MESFRPAGTLKQFLSDLKSSKDNKKSLMVWQTVKDKKHLLRGTYSSHSKNKEKTIVNIELDKNHSFDQGQPIYLFEEVNGILFKGEYQFYVNQNLKLVIDDKVFLREKRKSNRFAFHYSNVSVAVKYSNADFEFSLKDVSDKGYSILVASRIAKSFIADNDIDLMGVHGIKLPREIKGKIVHVTKSPHKAESNKSIVGIKFNKKSKLFSIIAKEMGLA